MGLGVGAWVRDMKAAALRGEPDDTVVRAKWKEDGATLERVLTLGELRPALEMVPGEKIAYVSDVIFSEASVERIARLARDADHLFIESPFLDEEEEQAARKRHLTAKQAGIIAREARVRAFTTFHFSPRHAAMEERLRAEAVRAFGVQAGA
jgi:ribonuclease Z